ncbi:putative B-ketoadipate enol-lactone hydrolase [Streptomyces hygroscopicus subsp. jinggangensis 5008]|nr:putative B-ketoadipate enol-lactone hydrolase [Streptomyces hygroscopicus subsp. jinggangensis 5008]
MPALLPRIVAPTLVIAGDQDGLVPPGYYEALAERVGDGRLGAVPGAGHYPEIERPEETVALIRKFSADRKACLDATVKEGH